jgi:hypothetical protein
VLFAIEIARRKIEEDCSGSLLKLNALLKEWEHVGKVEEVSTAPESIKGLDFGIRLVVWRVRRSLLRSVQQKAPASGNGSKAAPDIEGSR